MKVSVQGIAEIEPSPFFLHYGQDFETTIQLRGNDLAPSIGNRYVCQRDGLSGKTDM